MERSTPTLIESDVGVDTGLLVYGVTRGSLDVPADLRGVDATPVRLVTHGAIAAVVSEIPLERPPGRRAELVAYSEVLDALVAEGPVLPVRFGSVMADERQVVEELLAPDTLPFAELLDELEGRAQFNLRATYHEDVVLAEAVAGDPEISRLRDQTRHLPEEAAYAERVRLGELVARHLERSRTHDAQVLLGEILPHVEAYRERPGTGLTHLLDVALLVDLGHREDFENRLEALAESLHERVHLRLVGPVAAYDFVKPT